MRNAKGKHTKPGNQNHEEEEYAEEADDNWEGENEEDAAAFIRIT